MKKSTSIHNFNGDYKLNYFSKISWVLLNFVNNKWFPHRANSGLVKHFCSKITERDWTHIHMKASPSRALSDLFWLKLDWNSIISELGQLNIFDTGAGSGRYALRLKQFIKKKFTYFGVDSSQWKDWQDLSSKHDFITLME